VGGQNFFFPTTFFVQRGQEILLERTHDRGGDANRKLFCFTIDPPLNVSTKTVSSYYNTHTPYTSASQIATREQKFTCRLKKFAQQGIDRRAKFTREVKI